jgi:hypothetical protein
MFNYFNPTFLRDNTVLPILIRRIILLLLVLVSVACAKGVHPFSVAHVDRGTNGRSRYPIAVNVAAVGTFPGRAKSGAGYFYDEVLEYRVWLHPEKGAAKLAGDRDYFAAFAQYEVAEAYARASAGAETPVVLVRQQESIDEKTPGKYEWVKQPRITEWKPEWLLRSHRDPRSIPEFIAARTHDRR